MGKENVHLMGFFRVGSYIVSNDFERFWELINTRLPVLTASVKDDYVIRQMVKGQISRERWKAMKRFESDGMCFIDPEYQYNPEYERKEPNVECMDVIFTMIPDEKRFAKIKQCWESTISNFDHNSRCSHVFS